LTTLITVGPTLAGPYLLAGDKGISAVPAFRYKFS
jgi:hypothetical protein